MTKLPENPWLTLTRAYQSSRRQLPDQSPERLRRLRCYALGIIDAVLDPVEKQYLTPQELITVLLATALAISKLYNKEAPVGPSRPADPGIA
jgi:hypothetical protein